MSSAAKSKVLPEGKYVDLSGGMQIHYHDLGSGYPVLFLQGSGGGASGWSNFHLNAPAFVEAGYRALLIDLPGYGYSSKPTDAIYTLDYFVEYVNEFLDKIGVSKLVLLGNSLGGAIAIGLALKYPQKVSQLILMSPGGIEDTPAYFAMPAMAIMKEVFMGGATSRDTLAQFIKKALVFDAASVSETMIDQRWEIFQLQNDQVIKTMNVPNLTDRLGEIKVPALVFWGIDDKLMPETGVMKLAKGLKDYEMVVTSQCGHWFMIEHTELFNRSCLAFLNTKLKLKAKAGK
jgi:4,5:9,10-diseco-3-hydroxy-5,9,17-trioxoandrosta-1(10),2-diene-4-oate hydrolase